ncbi:MAG: AgmX/PglI C-terminal domain-containing protein [Oligoflexia bacterium]|nr:AgmX/PglI C-terminal domain-containing protein [Oligoflexia bacterium]
MNQANILPTVEEKAKIRIQAELFESSGISLGSFVTETEDSVIIGSSKRADLVVPHQSVSKIHAMLRLMNETDLLLYDLGSEAGTFVSGKRIVERKLVPGEFFEIGEHKVKVNLVENLNGNHNSERALFYSSPCDGGNDLLEIVRVENGIVQDERTAARNGKIIFGRRKNEILFNEEDKGKIFLKRSDSANSNNVECIIPTGYAAEIYNGQNDLIRAETEKFQFVPQEKIRLYSLEGNKEIFIFWRAKGLRTGRKTHDAESPYLQKAMLICFSIASIILAIFSYVPFKEEVQPEALAPKSSYFRLSMDSAPASAPAAASNNEASNNNEKEVATPSKATSISNSISKLLSKKSNVVDNIAQNVARNGEATTRLNNLASNNMKAEEISGGSLGGGANNVNAISKGLAGGGGNGVGNLKGFGNGKGTSIGTGSGFGGKGFDMLLGGDEAEAIGGLDKALIAAVVQANLGQIKHCYERQLIINPNIFGKVVAHWTINAEGKVSTSSVKKTTMNNSAVENCITGKIKNWTFPKPKGGGQVIVSYPFLFKALN